LRRLFGIVLQDPFLFSGTIESNVRLGTPDIDRSTVEQAICEIGLADFIESLPEGVAPASTNGGFHALGRTAPAHQFRARPCPQSRRFLS